MSPHSLLHSPPNNKKPVVAVDLEGTLTAGLAWRGMYNYLLSHGQKKGVKGFYFSRLPEYFARRLTGRDLRAFKNRWIHDLLRLFHGFSEDEFHDMAVWAVENELWPKRRQDVLNELLQHQQDARRIIIVTGLFEPYVAALLDKLPGFEAIGTPIIFEDDRLTGELATPFNVGPNKVEKLQPFMSEGKIFAAYGDTGSDHFMLAASRHPVAVHPDKHLRQLANAEGWRFLE